MGGCRFCLTFWARSGGINVKCKNCTFHGSINLVAGSLTMGPFTSNTTNGFINETEAVADYIRNGFVEFRADGLGAHVELDNTIEATDKLISWTVPLPTIPITPLLVSDPFLLAASLFRPSLPRAWQPFR